MTAVIVALLVIWVVCCLLARWFSGDWKTAAAMAVCMTIVYCSVGGLWIILNLLAS